MDKLRVPIAWPLIVSKRRRWTYLWYIAFIGFLFTLYRLSGTDLGYDFSMPRGARLSSTAYSVLRPFDYIDRTRVRVVPELTREPMPQNEDEVVKAHDQRNDRYYQGGLRTLTSLESQPVIAPSIYDPYPQYNKRSWRKQWKGNFQACQGPRGRDLDRLSPEDMMMAYPGNQAEFPHPAFGAYEVMEMDNNVCTDRCTRFGAYGHSERDCNTPLQPEWEGVNWANLQAKCFERNSNRYAGPRDEPVEILYEQAAAPLANAALLSSPSEPPVSTPGPRHHARSAVLVRSWSLIRWTDNHIHFLRSIIMELGLHSGGEYEVFLLIDVHDDDYDLETAKGIQQVKDDHIPREFHDMTILFNQKLLSQWYPRVEEHAAVKQHLQPVQAFSQLHPHFEYVWQFEMDMRHTGHLYHFLERAVSFAREQPRKFLWERNNYWYTPGAHGSWSDFKSMVNASLRGREHETVWGPVNPREVEINPIGPKPPTASPKDDNFVWGVGEDADLITFLPFFDPQNSEWTFPNVLYNVTKKLPRRASVVTMWRLSRRLLNAMHQQLSENGRAVVSEMSGPTWAMLHGLKAVHVPHPMYVDGQWTSAELARIYNRNPDDHPERINGGPLSLWNWNHRFDRIMYRLTYMFTTQFAEDLFRRYLGYIPQPEGLDFDDAGFFDEERYGRICFPPIMLHTIKNTGIEKIDGQAVPH